MSDETREQVLRVGREEFGGASADETIRRLLDEHWRAAAVAAVRRSYEAEPGDGDAYRAEAQEWESVEAPIVDAWVE